MKKYFSSKTMIALVVAIAAAAGYENLVSAQPIPPPATAAALPAGIQPGTPVAEVAKLAQAGVDASVIQNYIASCPGDFNVSADEIIALTDAGLSSTWSVLAGHRSGAAAFATRQHRADRPVLQVVDPDLDHPAVAGGAAATMSG